MKNVTTHPSRSIGFLSRLHDGEVSDAERRGFAAHCAECGECAAAAAEFEEVLALYRQARAEPADPELAARISRKIDARLRWRAPARYVRLEIDLLWASVVAICLVGALALYSFRVTRTHPAPVSMVAESKPIATSPSLATSPPIAKSAPQHRSEPSPKPPASGGFAPEAAPAVPALEATAPNRHDAEDSRSVSADQATPGPAATRKEGGEADGEIFRVGPGITAPVLVDKVDPVFPESLRNRVVAGKPVVLEAVVNERGDVVSPRVIRSNPPFDRLVMDAVRRWKYKPATKDGKPVPVVLTVTCNIDVR